MSGDGSQEGTSASGRRNHETSLVSHARAWVTNAFGGSHLVGPHGSAVNRRAETLIR